MSRKRSKDDDHVKRRKVKYNDLYDSVMKANRGRKVDDDIISVASGRSRPKSMTHIKQKAPVTLPPTLPKIPIPMTEPAPGIKDINMNYLYMIPDNSRIGYYCKTTKGLLHFKSVFFKGYIKRKSDGMPFIIVHSGRQRRAVAVSSLIRVYMNPGGIGKERKNQIQELKEQMDRIERLLRHRYKK